MNRYFSYLKVLKYYKNIFWTPTQYKPNEDKGTDPNPSDKTEEFTNLFKEDY